MRTKSIPFVGLMLTCLLPACVTQTTKTASVLEAIEVPMGASAKPLAFRKVVLKIPLTRSIGQIGYGPFCARALTEIRIRSGRYALNEIAFTDAFRQQLQKHNYTLVGDPDALFEDTSVHQAEFMIAGLIRDIQANACYGATGFGDYHRGTASAYLKVEWQLYSTFDRKVVFKAETEGSDKIDNIIDNALDVALENAFANATQNLLANKQFHALLTGAESVVATSDHPELVIRNLGAPLRDCFDPVAVRPSVVTIRTGSGHGSGFFISADGYLLTNAHVVGDARDVRVILYSGRQVPGEVLRRSRRRDVALVKVGEEGFTPLALRFDDPPVGSDVLVYGTPYLERLEGTLTKGVLSAYRSDRGERFIQSDVNIHPGNSGGPMMDDRGNAIAVATKGLAPRGVMTGHNFFIPLPEAFEALRIRLPKRVLPSS